MNRAISSEPAEPVNFGEWPTFARRVRSQFQTALLNWLKEQSNPATLKPLRQVCETLYSRVQRKSLRRLWWINAQIIEGIEAGTIDNDLPLRRVFARLDLCLKAMLEDGQDGPPEDSITALSRALLFHVAQARKGCDAVDRLREEPSQRRNDVPVVERELVVGAHEGNERILDLPGEHCELGLTAVGHGQLGNRLRQGFEQVHGFGGQLPRTIAIAILAALWAAALWITRKPVAR